MTTPLRLSLRQLQIFESVARTGSTRAASEEIALSQSATSAAVNELERLLAMRLFDRAGKRLLLNDNGRELLPRARALLEAARQLEDLGQSAAARLQSVRIGASMTVAAHLVPPLLAALYEDELQHAPHWKSSVAVGNTSEICAAVAAFELDLGLIEGPCHDPALDVHAWVRDEMVVVASPQLAQRGPVRLGARELREAVWLLREPGSGTREATDQALLPHVRSYRRSIELASAEAIRHTAVLGLGHAVLSRWVVADLLASGALKEVRTVLPVITRQCYWVVHRDKHASAALQRCVDVLSAGAPIL
ncbi:LysR family transcriptional regulator [Ramlibacter ginsenosidimutans]|uniref:LysR family transcriptional regulator n=1 Tax=Ramlibacter ginsenosidimutans TaxID=502333 RepID=A0A934TTX0_9BURK|nr:LysR substrate-binding domain-containing protein [Ramlibacter ginsenosidimutans]MBK6007313.1 LysR family transcriptional regulator [Ramlibacter ginsenosidimutans]